MKHLLGDWLRGGKLFSAIYDTEYQDIRLVMGEVDADVTTDIRIRSMAYSALARYYLKKEIQRKKSDNLEPELGSLEKNQVLVLTQGVKCAARDRVECGRCGGTGKWVNPADENDKRVCYNCSGYGYLTPTIKGKWRYLETGTEITIERWSAHGGFGGKVERHEVTIYGRTGESELVSAKLSKCRRPGRYEYDQDALWLEAKGKAMQGRFSDACGVSGMKMDRCYCEYPEGLWDLKGEDDVL